MTSDGHLTTCAEVATSVKLQQTVVVSEGVDKVIAVLHSSADYRDTEELTVVVVNDLSIVNAASNGESVELSVASSLVLQGIPCKEHV